MSDSDKSFFCPANKFYSATSVILLIITLVFVYLVNKKAGLSYTAFFATSSSICSFILCGLLFIGLTCNGQLGLSGVFALIFGLNMLSICSGAMSAYFGYNLTNVSIIPATPTPTPTPTTPTPTPTAPTQ